MLSSLPLYPQCVCLLLSSAHACFSWTSLSLCLFYFLSLYSPVAYLTTWLYSLVGLRGDAICLHELGKTSSRQFPLA